MTPGQAHDEVNVIVDLIDCAVQACLQLEAEAPAAVLRIASDRLVEVYKMLGELRAVRL